MKLHELKCDPVPFKLVVSGTKNYELRKNDRDFQDGDILWLRETVRPATEITSPNWLAYTGHEYLCRVTHVLSGYGLQEGYVILSLAELIERHPS